MGGSERSERGEAKIGRTATVGPRRAGNADSRERAPIRETRRTKEGEEEKRRQHETLRKRPERRRDSGPRRRQQQRRRQHAVFILFFSYVPARVCARVGVFNLRACRREATVHVPRA